MSLPKVIQIAVTGTDEGDILYALCDDGSLWFKALHFEGQETVWVQIDIPDPKPPNKPPTS